MLVSAQQEYDQQARLTALAVLAARRAGRSGSEAVAASVRQYQAAAAALSMAALNQILDEQGIDTATAGTVLTRSLLTDPGVVSSMHAATQTADAADRLVQTLVQDASRTTRAVDMATRPAITVYIRSLSPPSCSRCAILAGRIYRWSTGFQRHPRCDCLMTPTTDKIGPTLVTSPTEAVDKGWVAGLSKDDMTALDKGADLNQVVNVRSKKAGLTYGNTVMKRGSRLTPAGCIQLADSRHAAIDLLKHHGYITT